MSVLVPSIFGFWAVNFLLSTYIKDTFVVLLASLCFSLLLLVIDSTIVTTLSKTRGGGLLIRIAISICLGIVVSEPATLFIFSKSINEHIENKLGGEKKSAHEKLNTELLNTKSMVSNVENKLNSLKSKRSNYNEDRVKESRFIENLNIKNGNLKTIAESKAKRISVLNEKISQLEGNRKEKAIEIEKQLLEMEKEEQGKRASGRGGKGEHWEVLNKGYISLRHDELVIQKQIVQTQNSITEIQGDNSAESKVNETFSAKQYFAKTGTSILNDDEQKEKEHLDIEIDNYKKQQNEYLNKILELESKISNLDSKFEFKPDNYDSISQTNALYEIATENLVLKVKILGLFFFVFFMDSAAVIAKITVQTLYDDGIRHTYQETLSDYLQGTANYARNCRDIIEGNFNELNNLSTRLTSDLNNTNPPDRRYHHENTLHQAAKNWMNRLYRQLDAPEDLNASSNPLWQWFQVLWSAIKAKLGW
jgi:hypothetical protein